MSVPATRRFRSDDIGVYSRDPIRHKSYELTEEKPREWCWFCLMATGLIIPVSGDMKRWINEDRLEAFEYEENGVRATHLHVNCYFHNVRH